MEAPANVHREWLRLKKSRSPPPDFELPTLSPREQFEQRKVSRTQKLSAKEEHEENLARKCADEKKSRINEAKAIKADVETFTKTYVQDLVEREREGRERAKRARDEELKLHEQWCHNMAAARRAHDPAVASARRQAALEASYRTRHLIEELVKEAHPDEKSPPRVHAREVSDVRKAVLADHHLWEEMKESQTIADRELQHAKRTHVKAIHNTMKDSVSAEYSRRHETAESQRKSISEYRELWEKEASKWRNGLNESVKADRESHVKAISKRAELLQRHAEEENEAGVKLREALRAQRLKNKEEHEELNRQRAATVRQTTQLTLSAREALIEKNRRAFLDTKAESERRAALKQRDKEEDFSTRKALHDEEAQRARSPKSPRPTTSGSNQRTPAPPGTAPAGSARRPTTQGQAQE